MRTPPAPFPVCPQRLKARRAPTPRQESMGGGTMGGKDLHLRLRGWPLVTPKGRGMRNPHGVFYTGTKSGVEHNNGTGAGRNTKGSPQA